LDATLELPAAEPSVRAAPDEAPTVAEFPPTLHTVQRRPFGLSATAVLAALAGLGLGVTVVMFAVGAWIGGLLALALVVVVAALFRSAVRREPDSETARVVRRAGVETLSLWRLGAVSLRAWTGASLELARLQRRRRRLQRDLNGRLRPLGEAVLQEDPVRAEVLKAQAEVLAERLHELERDVTLVSERARERVERERAVSQPTESLKIDGRRAPG
jgi:hypothetical protein